MVDIVEPGTTKRAPVIGIDLGTTHSLVGHVEEGKVCLFADASGTVTIPSVVSYGEENVLVGTPAIEKLDAIYSIKRQMGWGEGKSAKKAVQTSADILKYLKKVAEEKLGKTVYEAVITVPAYFNDAQRQATKDAAKLADLTVLRLLSEPTAAAVAYGLRQKKNGLFLVYDLGGGTFDVSLLKLTGGIFKVIATGGNTHLGGDDFDALIAKKMNVSLRRAKDIKEKISQEETYAGLSQKDFAEMAAPLMAETIQICKSVLKDADVEVESLDEMILVGGSSRMPSVEEALRKAFPELKMESSLNPEEVVAMGAAFQAYNMTGGNRDDMLLLDIAPLSLGLETMGGLVEKVIERNTPIPITRAQDFTTFKDGQNAMDIHVLQGERETVNACRSLAKFRLKGIPALPAGMARIRVVFALDADGILTVTAKEQSTGVEQQIEVTPSYGISEKEMLIMLKESLVHAKEDVSARMIAEAKIELESVIDACESAYKSEISNFAEMKDALDTHLKEARTLLADDSATKESLVDMIEDLDTHFSALAAERVNRAVKMALVGEKIEKEIK